MALSGQTGTTTKWQGTHIYFLDWTATQDTLNNQSAITIRLRLQLTHAAGKYETGTTPRAWSITCGGQTDTGWIPAGLSLSPGGTYTLITTTITFTHTNDGTLTFSLSGNCDTPGGGGYAYIPAGSFTLDVIPRGMIYVRNAGTAGAPARGQVFIGNAGGVPVQAKEVYVGNAGGVPVRAT